MGTTTLLILDIEKGILDTFDDNEEYLQRLSKTLVAARRNEINVIHIITAFRPGYPECHPFNSGFCRVAASGKFQEGDQTTEIGPAVAPIKGEAVVTKRRVSAFSGTDLDILLRSSNTERVVIAGIATNGAVLSTVCSAHDMDYRITVLSDLCRDRDDETHSFLVRKALPRKADVITGQEWIDQIEAATCE